LFIFAVFQFSMRISFSSSTTADFVWNVLMFCRAIACVYEDIPVEEMTAHHPSLFLTKDASPSTKVHDLALLDMKDHRGREIRVYDQSGRRVNRRKIVDRLNDNPCGVLLNLSTVERAFTEGGPPPYYSPLDMVVSKVVDKYPAAFIREAGSIQTRQPLPSFTPIIADINERLAARRTHAVNQVLNDDNELVPEDLGPQQAVFTTSTQIYNRSLHYLAPRASEHVALHGEATAAAGAMFVSNPSNKRASREALRRVEHTLPFERLEEKFDGPHLSKDLRVEQVHIIRSNRIKNGLDGP
jgi:hypothetical protein